MKTFDEKQNGGLLLGLIIGALVGLGAALAVAVYVTKVPIPFLNKTQSRSVDTDAAEAKKNKDWNPNLPLAGKSPGKPAPVEAPAVGTEAALPKPAAAASVPVAVKPKVSADPLGDLAKAKSQVRPDAPVPASGPDPFSYFIQAGAFRTAEDAEQQRAKLSMLGFQAKVTEREQSGRTVFRVRLGPFDKKEDADNVKEKLEGNSVETAMVRVQR